jgi:hypothetical protein
MDLYQNWCCQIIPKNLSAFRTQIPRTLHEDLHTRVLMTAVIYIAALVAFAPQLLVWRSHQDDIAGLRAFTMSRILRAFSMSRILRAFSMSRILRAFTMSRILRAFSMSRILRAFTMSRIRSSGIRRYVRGNRIATFRRNLLPSYSRSTEAYCFFFLYVSSCIFHSSLFIKHRQNALHFTTLLYFNRPLHMFRFLQNPSSGGSKLHTFHIQCHFCHYCAIS